MFLIKYWLYILVIYCLKPAALALFWTLVGSHLLSADPGSESMYRVEVGQYESSFAANGFAWDRLTTEVFDADELVKEFDNSLFVMTDLLQVQQRKTTCDDPSTACLTSDDCKQRSYMPSTLVSGLYTGECNVTTSHCLVNGWCDVDQTPQPEVYHALQGIGKLRLNIEYITRFPGFKTNVTGNINQSIEGIWKAIPSESGTTLEQALSAKGDSSLSLSVDIEVTCIRSYDGNQDSCTNNHTFSQLQSITSTQKGNTRHLEQFTKKAYYQGTDGSSMRHVTTASGVLVSVNMRSQIAQFTILNFMSGLGSYIPYWDKANIIGFFILVKILKVDVIRKQPSPSNSGYENQL